MATTQTTLTKKRIGVVSRPKDTSKMEPQNIMKQDTVTDLTSFEEVTLQKHGTFTPVATAAEAMTRVGNDTAKFLKAINDGLRAEAIRNLGNDTNVPWQEYDEETKELKPFTGSPASKKVVNPLVLTLAKTIFKYNKDMKAEDKKAAKDSAREMIRTNPAMVAGLKESAMVAAADDEE